MDGVRDQKCGGVGSAAEERLRNRLELASAAVAALAHDINQPLAAAATYLDVARRMLGKAAADPEEIAQILEKASAQTQRASRLVGSLRETVRLEESDKTQTSLHDAIRTALDALRAEDALGDVRVTLELAAPRDGVLADKLRIILVLSNLLRNAVAAMRPTGRRDLCFRTSNPDAATIKADLLGAGDNPVNQLNGEALALNKAKEMGLGLLSSLIIIEELDGRIWAGSNHETGALFSLTLPLQGLDIAS